jgi:hypothetical protein
MNKKPRRIDLFPALVHFRLNILRNLLAAGARSPRPHFGIVRPGILQGILFKTLLLSMFTRLSVSSLRLAIA